MSHRTDEMSQMRWDQMSHRTVKMQRILPFGDNVVLGSSYPKSWPGTSLNLKDFIKREISTLLSNSARVWPMQCRGPREKGKYAYRRYPQSSSSLWAENRSGLNLSGSSQYFGLWCKAYGNRFINVPAGMKCPPSSPSFSMTRVKLGTLGCSRRVSFIARLV